MAGHITPAERLQYEERMQQLADSYEQKLRQEKRAKEEALERERLLLEGMETLEAEMRELRFELEAYRAGAAVVQGTVVEGTPVPFS